MGYFIEEEEDRYRKLFAPAAGGGVLFLIGLLLLLFGRGYISDGSNYDLFIFFGSVLMVFGGIVICFPLLLQLRILFKGVKRNDPGPMAGYVPAQSAAEQIMRNTQIFSSAPPSTYDGGNRAPFQSQPQQQPQAPPHQFSSAAAAFASGSMDQLKQSQTSLNREPQPAQYMGPYAERAPSGSTSSIGAPPPTYRQAQQQHQPPMPPPKPSVEREKPPMPEAHSLPAQEQPPRPGPRNRSAQRQPPMSAAQSLPAHQEPSHYVSHSTEI